MKLRTLGRYVGTVDRHFPTRAQLFGTVVVESLWSLADEARALADAPDPGEEFYRFFYVTKSSAKPHERYETTIGRVACATDGLW